MSFRVPFMLRVLATAMALSSLSLTASAARIGGRVLDPEGMAVARATVTILESGRRATSGDDGIYSLGDIPAGDWTLEAESRLGASGLAQVTVAGGSDVSIDIVIDVMRQHETVVVSASPDVRGHDEMYQAASVLEDRELARRAETSLGETLAGEPGVHGAWFGPGASRPVIRGFAGDRVRIMTNGLEVGDASSTSPDHAVGAGPLGAERIEIIRGPATLMYGSNAIGGAVNVLDNRIPSVVPDEAVSGSVLLRGGSAADEIAGAVSLDGGGRQVAWHLDGYTTSAGDLDTPIGVLENTQVESDGYSAGLSWVGAKAFVGVSGTAFDTDYGSAAEEGVTIDLEQRRLDLRGEVRDLAPLFRGLRFRAGTSDYEHVEFEGDEVGTRFLNDSWEARVEALHGRLDGFSGSAGIQYTSRDLSALGEESFVPPTDTRSVGVFAFEDFRFGKLSLQVGGRFDRREIRCDACAVKGVDFDGVSASVGILRDWESGWSLSASLTRAIRHPNAEELFAEGPHLATGIFERGRADLDSEISHGVELGVRHHGERWHAEANVFSSWFDGFIRESATGGIEDGLPVFEFTQGDATTRGAEISLDFELLHREPHHVRLETVLDFVDTEQDGGDALPRTPALRGKLAIRYEGTNLWALLEGRWVAKQDDRDALETSTEGWFDLDAAIGLRIVAGPTVHDLILAASNVTDELQREHVSFLKDIAPLPGRNVTLTWKMLF